jgi:hypothetical protein
MPSLSSSQSHQQSSHVAMTLFGHDPLVSQETHKRDTEVCPTNVSSSVVVVVVIVVVPIAPTIITRCYDFIHDALVSQETYKRVIPKFVQQMCRQVLSSSSSSSSSQSHQQSSHQSSHVAMTLFGHDALVSQETYKRVIPKFVQQMCRQVLSSLSSSRRHHRRPNRTNNHHTLL